MAVHGYRAAFCCLPVKTLICRAIKAVFPIASFSAMNKQELVDSVVERTAATVTKKDTDLIITATIEAIIEAVAAGEKVTLVGFGTFERRDRGERVGRNPKTGEEMTIPAAKVPAFSAGKGFKVKVNPAPAPERELVGAGAGSKTKGKKK